MKIKLTITPVGERIDDKIWNARTLFDLVFNELHNLENKSGKIEDPWGTIEYQIKKD